ncbi:uncharacterized protein [Centruroides vittatus]|uniref:uncharacterized protein n=1 Tax=Centruroides vittatus TaxID=120091 RepID=UPI00350F4C29
MNILVYIISFFVLVIFADEDSKHEDPCYLEDGVCTNENDCRYNRIIRTPNLCSQQNKTVCCYNPAVYDCFEMLAADCVPVEDCGGAIRHPEKKCPDNGMCCIYL